MVNQRPQKYFTNQNFIHFIKDTKTLGFPGGAVVENLPANAGDTGSSPGLGRSHMPRSNWACEPQLLSLRVWSLCSARREAAIVRGPRTAMKRGPHLPQLEKALAQKRRPNTDINKLKKKKKRYKNTLAVKLGKWERSSNQWDTIIYNVCLTERSLSPWAGLPTGESQNTRYTG